MNQEILELLAEKKYSAVKQLIGQMEEADLAKLFEELENEEDADQFNRLFRLLPCFRFWGLPPELRPLVFCFVLLRREALPEVPSFFLPAVLWPDFAARGAFSSGAADAMGFFAPQRLR